MELVNEQVIYSSEKCVIVKGEYNGHQCTKKTGGFSREAALAIAQINSPYIPHIYEIGNDYIIAEYVDGIDLSNAKILPRSVLGVALELCGALEALHKSGVIHRDVKPSNIILCGDGHIKLIDFDAARIKKTATDKDTVFIGTDGFAPPEQFGFAQTDERSDIYSFGVTIKLLLGNNYARSPYRRVIEKCTRFDPGRRYSSIKAVRSALIRCKYLPIVLPCLAVAVAAAIITVIARTSAGVVSTSSEGIISTSLEGVVSTSSAGIVSTPSDDSSVESSVGSTGSPTFIYPFAVPEDRTVIWEILALPKGFPKLSDGVFDFDFDENYDGMSFNIYWLEMADEEFLEIEGKLKKWLKTSEDSVVSEYRDGEKRELSNSRYDVSIYKYRDFAYQSNWRCWISINDRSTLSEYPQLDFSFADPSAAELGERSVRWEDTELNGVIPKLAENITAGGIQWGDCYAEWDKMSLGEAGCVLRKITDRLEAEISRQHIDGDSIYQWTFRADIDGELKYISVDYIPETQSPVLVDEPQMSVSIR